jgi:hypothetical protein
MELSEGHKEDLRNQFEDGYSFGRIDERKRIQLLIELDLLVPAEVKPRLFDLINGGQSDD